MLWEIGKALLVVIFKFYNMTRVSILMNAYNAQKYLKEAIDSIYAQTFENWEIIFIDNCSTDRTKEIVDSYDNKIKYYKTIENIPLGQARNFGLKKCKSEYIAFLDTDDIWLPDKLEKQIALLDNELELQMCYGGVIYIDEDSKEIGKDIPKASSGYVFPQLLRRYEINMQTVLIRNDIEIKFNDEMKFSPDFDLFVKISTQYKIGVIKDIVVKYRKLSTSLTSKTIHLWGVETEKTLNSIFKKSPKLKEKYSKEYDLAYAKVGYYYAQYYKSIGKHKEARLALRKYTSLGYQYQILYILSYFPTSFWNFIHRFK